MIAWYGLKSQLDAFSDAKIPIHAFSCCRYSARSSEKVLNEKYQLWFKKEVLGHSEMQIQMADHKDDFYCCSVLISSRNLKDAEIA